MYIFYIITFIVTELTIFSHQHSTPESSYYTAAVVEYHVDLNTTVNLEAYIHFMKKAALQDVDIIVFPEVSLTYCKGIQIPYVPGQRSTTAPCDDTTTYHEVLTKLSCAARESKLYALINTYEQLRCTNQTEIMKNPECGGRGKYGFVTNIVFDRDGYIIDKYRKKYMDETPGLNPSPDRDAIGFFDTDFGIRFGHFACFDLMFQVPPVQIVQKNEIKNILYNAMWVNDIPFLAAAEFHEGYARAFNINFIVAGAIRPIDGNAGSGIYSGKAGPLISYTPRDVNNTMLVSRVPKKPAQVTGPIVGPIESDPRTVDVVKSRRNNEVPGYVGQDVKETEDLQVIRLKDGNVTCTFHVQLKILRSNLTKDMKFYRYRAVVTDSMHKESRHRVHTTVCCIVACTNESVSSCGDRFLRHENLTTAYEFTNLNVTSDGPHLPRSASCDCDNAVYYPRALSHELNALEGGAYKSRAYTHEVRGGRLSRLIVWLRKPRSNLLSYGVWGRIFTDDVIDTSEDIKWP